MKIPRVLPRLFFTRSTVIVAKQLLGKYLVFQTAPETPLVGKIVETEAYRGMEDKACHASWRKRESCEVLWGEPGKAYVYLTYGMHNMFNVVTEKDGLPAAVLIRALEPVEGLKYMESNRELSHSSLRVHPKQSQSDCHISASRRILAMTGHKTMDTPTILYRLTSGPGKLTQAFGITYKNHNGLDVTSGRILWIEDRGDRVKPSELMVGQRIGVAYAGEWATKPWRFYIRDNPYVSKK
ncbi:MAG: DNA-3-methyladenine glycosylase [Patescibacteria group bacterium]